MVDPDQMLQTTASDHSLHCLPLIQQFLDMSTGSNLDVFKFYDKCSNELWCPNI